MMRDIFKIALVMVAVAIVIAPVFDEPSSGDSFSASIEGYVKVNGVLAYNDSIEITVHYPLAPLA